MVKPLVSIIIPVYNVEKYLSECIDSVINQTYNNLEIILIDDGSTDSSGNICDKYSIIDNRINVIHKINGGLSNARNDGFLNAQGDYVYFLDSDDFIEITAVENLVKNILENNSDVVFFDGITFNDYSNKKVKNQNYLRKNQYSTASGLEIFELLQKNRDYHSAVPLMFFKRQFLLENNLKFIPHMLHEDMVYTFQTFINAKVVSYCDKPLYNRRNRASSITTSNKSIAHFNGIKKAYEEVVSVSVEADIIENKAVVDYICRLAFNIFNTYDKLCLKDKLYCKKELSKFKSCLLNNNAYFNKALYWRCFGKLFWFIYKIIIKLFK